MILVVDIGNTSTKFGVFREGNLIARFRQAVKANGNGRLIPTVKETGAEISRLLKRDKLDNLKIEGLAICSVVPGMTPVYVELAEKYFKADAWLLDYTCDLGMKIDVDNPSEVGSDRLANAVAVKAIYGYPAIAIDLGTATTFSVVNGDGNFAGGVIAPGVTTSAAELSRRASKLSEVELEKPERCIGKNTIEAMKAGIFYGSVGMIDFIVAKIIEELNASDVKVIATGGHAEKLASRAKTVQKIHSTLTLEGIALTYMKNKQKGDKHEDV